MFLCSRVLRPYTRKAVINCSRYFRPTVKISKDKFQVTLDIRRFERDEIRVKARPDYVVIEGKQERKMKNGYVLRQFVKKYRLPSGCDPRKMCSTMSEQGILTITAPRDVSAESKFVSEYPVPIKYCGTEEEQDPNLINVDVKKECAQEKSLCDFYMPKVDDPCQPKCECPKVPPKKKQ